MRETAKTGTTSQSHSGGSASSSLVTGSPVLMTLLADILSNSSLIFFPSESEEKPRRSMPSKPAQISGYEVPGMLCGVQKGEVKH